MHSTDAFSSTYISQVSVCLTSNSFQSFSQMVPKFSGLDECNPTYFYHQKYFLQQGGGGGGGGGKGLSNFPRNVYGRPSVTLNCFQIKAVLSEVVGR